MPKNHIHNLCNEFRRGLEAYEWDFDAVGFIERAQKKSTPEQSSEVLDELLVVWMVWRLDLALRNDPACEI
jgi:hypothetical protein